MINRRDFLIGSTFVAAGVAGASFAAKAAMAADQTIIAVPMFHQIVLGSITQAMNAYSVNGAQTVPSVLRMKREVMTTIDVTNQLDAATTVHWHGLRVANSEDGVPFISQGAIEPGKTHRYNLKSPDAGTFWFHPHCNTLEQMARGLSGVIIVDEDEDAGFDLDLPVLMRDFRMDGKGKFIEFAKAKNAAYGGTLGTISTANWQIEPEFEAPAGGLVRVRIVVGDVTRIFQPSANGAEMRIIAYDGQPVAEPVGFEGLSLAPGQRIDVAVAMPSEPGALVEFTRDGPKGSVRMFALKSTGPDLKRTLGMVKPLPANPLKEPDLSKAETLEFLFEWSPGGDAPQPSICGTPQFQFWSINKVAWSDAQASLPEPTATLKMGQSYILRFINKTPNSHPVHLHGMTFKILKSDKRELAQLWSDTALLLSGETVEVALIADNPGDWAIHCHVIEHQKTGLTGYIRVS
jgi:FtsP/CotA-like multicopper oxidase with cupredoxin domain